MIIAHRMNWIARMAMMATVLSSVNAICIFTTTVVQPVTARVNINATTVICGAALPVNNVFVGQKAATIDPNCVIVVG